MRSGSGSCTRAHDVEHALAPCARGIELGVDLQHLVDLLADSVMTGLSAVIGSWKIIDMRVQRSVAQPRVARRQQFLALEQDLAARSASAPFGSRPMTAKRDHRLARAGFADQADDLAGIDRQARAAAPRARGRRRPAARR